MGTEGDLLVSLFGEELLEGGIVAEAGEAVVAGNFAGGDVSLVYGLSQIRDSAVVHAGIGAVPGHVVIDGTALLERDHVLQCRTLRLVEDVGVEGEGAFEARFGGGSIAGARYFSVTEILQME